MFFNEIAFVNGNASVALDHFSQDKYLGVVATVNKIRHLRLGPSSREATTNEPLLFPFYKLVVHNPIFIYY